MKLKRLGRAGHSAPTTISWTAVPGTTHLAVFACFPRRLRDRGGRHGLPAAGKRRSRDGAHHRGDVLHPQLPRPVLRGSPDAMDPLSALRNRVAQGDRLADRARPHRPRCGTQPSRRTLPIGSVGGSGPAPWNPRSRIPPGTRQPGEPDRARPPCASSWGLHSGSAIHGPGCWRSRASRHSCSASARVM